MLALHQFASAINRVQMRIAMSPKQGDGLMFMFQLFVFLKSLFRRLIVQPRTPKADREDICPHKKQTIHNALKRPKDLGPLEPHQTR